MSIGDAIKPVKSFTIFHFRWYISDTHMQTERTVLFQDLDPTGRTRKLGLRLMAPAACCASWMDALPALPVRSQEWVHWSAKSAPAEGRLLPHTKHKARIKDPGSRSRGCWRYGCATATSANACCPPLARLLRRCCASKAGPRPSMANSRTSSLRPWSWLLRLPMPILPVVGVCPRPRCELVDRCASRACLPMHRLAQTGHDRRESGSQ